MFTASSILFYHLLVFFFSYQSILLYTRLLLTLCHVTILPLATPLTLCISYQMLLTSLIPKHMYSYISENNFETSNQIIVPTSYMGDIWRLLTTYDTVTFRRDLRMSTRKRLPASYGCNMEAAGSPKTLVTAYKTIYSHNPEDQS